MAAQLVLDELIQDGQRHVEQFALDAGPVAAAFWSVPADDERRPVLVIAAETYDRDGPTAAYRKLEDARQKLPGFVETPRSAIRLVSARDSLAQRVIDFARRHPRRLAVSGDDLGLAEIELFYIYPFRVFQFDAHGAMRSDEVVQKIVEGLARPDPLTSTVQMKDGTSFHGIPVSLERSAQELEARFIDVDHQGSRAIGVADIRAIH